MTSLKLTARKITVAGNPAWNILQGESQQPRLVVISSRFGWDVQAQPGRYGISYDDQDAARAINDQVGRKMGLHHVLAIVRSVLEAQHEMFRQEALAELETERRSEAFWENRMTDADYEQEREEWARDEWLCALEEGRR